MAIAPSPTIVTRSDMGEYYDWGLGIANCLQTLRFSKGGLAKSKCGSVLFDELPRFQNENSSKALPESPPCIGSRGWQRKKIGIEGDNVRCRSGDCKFNKHRITRIAFEFEFHSHGSVFVSDVA